MNLSILNELKVQTMRPQGKLKRRAGYNTSQVAEGPEAMLKRMRVSSDLDQQQKEEQGEAMQD